jgi:hypothetical protein
VRWKFWSSVKVIVTCVQLQETGPPTSWAVPVARPRAQSQLSALFKPVSLHATAAFAADFPSKFVDHGGAEVFVAQRMASVSDSVCGSSETAVSVSINPSVTSSLFLALRRNGSESGR